MTKEQTFNDLFREAGLEFNQEVSGSAYWKKIDELSGRKDFATAWIKEFPDGSKIYVTDESRTRIPNEDDDIIAVGLVGSEDEIFYYVRHRYVRIALDKVERIIAAYPDKNFEL